LETPDAPLAPTPPTALRPTFIDKVVKVMYDVCLREGCRDVTVIELTEKTHWVQFLIIATSLAARHNVAVAEKIKKELKSAGLVRAAKIERNEEDMWVIVTAAGAVSLQLMVEAQRNEIDLERLWVLKRSKDDSFLHSQEEEEFIYDEEDAMEDDEPRQSSGWNANESLHTTATSATTTSASSSASKRRKNNVSPSRSRSAK